MVQSKLSVSVLLGTVAPACAQDYEYSQPELHDK